MKTFKYLNCHPKYKKYKSCFNDKTLLTLRRTWNKIHPDRKIRTKKRDHIESQLRNHLKSCNDQQCLLNHTMKSNIKTNFFAPFSPKKWEDKKNKSVWLDSLDIIRVMKQYEETYPHFDFLGPSPMDFDARPSSRCVWPELCELSIKKHLKMKHRQIGIIFNTDPHYKEGSHWVCMFIDLEQNYILYFDSTGVTPPREITALIDRVVEQCRELNKPMKVVNNRKKHQYSNSECGMYALYVILQLLEKKHDLNYFLNERIPDETVRRYRSIFYNSSA